MGWANTLPKYTTEHEREYIDRLVENGNRLALENYVALADYRDWGGMDRAECVAYAQRGLAALNGGVQ